MARGLPDSVPGLIDRTGRRDQLHQIGAAAVRADRQAAADDLAEAGEIGPDCRTRLRAAGGGAEARDHFVEDQQSAVRWRTCSRSARRNPSAGGTTPMLPAIGSTISAAIWSRLASNNRCTEPRSL